MNRVKISKNSLESFHHEIARHKKHPRLMPWRECNNRGCLDEYHVLVSEVMLQQTQVSRVVPKFNDFIERFPNIQDLAVAPLCEVLSLWSGLGYNRRAKYLHDAAKELVHAKKPWSVELLSSQKGIGPNTAKAVVVYAYNQPEVFIETNIRTVYLHHFFSSVKKVDDQQILELVEGTLDSAQPRLFYWSLMDYGTELKAKSSAHLSRSTTHKKQAAFEGSVRQLRGNIMKELVQSDVSVALLRAKLKDSRFDEVVASLTQEQLIIQKGNMLSLPN